MWHSIYRLLTVFYGVRTTGRKIFVFCQHCTANSHGPFPGCALIVMFCAWFMRGSWNALVYSSLFQYRTVRQTNITLKHHRTPGYCLAVGLGKVVSGTRRSGTVVLRSQILSSHFPDLTAKQRTWSWNLAIYMQKNFALNKGARSIVCWYLKWVAVGPGRQLNLLCSTAFILLSSECLPGTQHMESYFIREKGSWRRWVHDRISSAVDIWDPAAFLSVFQYEWCCWLSLPSLYWSLGEVVQYGGNQYNTQIPASAWNRKNHDKILHY